MIIYDKLSLDNVSNMKLFKTPYLKGFSSVFIFFTQKTTQIKSKNRQNWIISQLLFFLAFQ